MTGIIIAACAAILLAGAGPLWQWYRTRRTVADHSSTLNRLGGRIQGSAGPGRGPAAGPPAQSGGWADPPPPPPAGASPYAPPPRPPGRPRSAGLRWLPVSGAVMALGIVAAAVALTAGRSGGHGYTPTADAHRRSPGRVAAPSTTTPSRPANSAPASSTAAGGAPAATTTPSTTGPAPAGGRPVLSSVSPAAAAAGQTVTLTGSNLFSPSGRIVVMFGSTQAGVSCPTQTTCRATVPPRNGHSPSTPVSITTDAGTSAPVRFSYR